MVTRLKNPTTSDELVLTAELGSAQQRALNRRVKTHPDLRRLHPGVYSDRPPADWPALVARHRLRVLAALFPGAVFGFRSALAGALPVDGVVHLSYSYDRRVDLPGLQVVLVHGAGAQPGDNPMGEGRLYFPSNARIFLENLATSRARPARAAGRTKVEERLLDLCDARGAEALARIRDEARLLAEPLGLTRAFAVLDALIGSILGTRPARGMTSERGLAWTAALPYDAQRLELFGTLAAHLRTHAFADRPSVATSPPAQTHFAFLEAYFSNFIEGTEFEVGEARAFVLDGQPIECRPKDSHDIVGVFRQASEPAWALQTMASGEPVLAQLRARHADQMQARPETNPGQFKDQANYAGNTQFVAPRAARGTLVQASSMLATLAPGMARALMAMFIVAEVHPFQDGNGRLARLVMNAELSTVGQCRIVIPTLYREQYLDTLRELTRSGRPGPFIRAMEHIQRWTASFAYEDLTETVGAMQRCHAFERSLQQHELLFPAPGGARRSEQAAAAAS